MIGAGTNTEYKVGVAGGTLVNIIVNIPGAELANAVVLSAVGAVTSFVATFLCRRLVEYGRKKWKRNK